MALVGCMNIAVNMHFNDRAKKCRLRGMEEAASFERSFLGWVKLDYSTEGDEYET